MPHEAPQWRRSSRCGNTTCVEVAKVGDDYLIRDSKNPTQPPLRLTGEGWTTLTASIRRGDL